MIMTIVAVLIVIVAIALWRATRPEKDSTPTNRYHKPKNNVRHKRSGAENRKAVKPQAVKRTQQASQKPQKSSKRSYQTESVNLHHPAYASDDIASTDKVLGVQSDHVSASDTEPMMDAMPVMLYLMADRYEPYVGSQVMQSLIGAGLRLNKGGQFLRRVTDQDQQRTLFGVAAMNDSGAFPSASLDRFETQGLIFYMDQAMPLSAFQSVFTTMLETMVRTKAQLGGHIFTPDKVLLEEHDFARYTQYLCGVDEPVQHVPLKPSVVE